MMQLFRDVSVSTVISASLSAAALICHGAIADVPADSPIAEQLRAAENAVERIVSQSPGEARFESTFVALDDLLTRLETDTSMTMFMAHVSTDAAERERGQRADQDWQNWIIELTKRDDLYRVLSAAAERSGDLKGEDARLVKHIMRDFRRAGMELSPENRGLLKAAQVELAALALAYQKNLAEDDTRVPMTAEELAGVSPDVVSNQPRVGDIHLVGLDGPTFIAVMEHAEHEAARAKLWLAYKRRVGQRNVIILEKMIEKRAAIAKLLGYDSTAEFETEIRMAKDLGTVREFYAKLRPLVREKALLDFEELRNAKREHTGDADANLYPWDQSFYKRRLQMTKYAVDSRKVQEYFPLDRVVEGLFSITQSLYGLRYRDITAEARSAGRKIWHDDVKLFQVLDASSGESLGEFSIDLHPRANKYSHAAQWGLVQRKEWSDGTVQLPVAALVCNFTKPTADKPSLLTHDEVETFFHEFGHCLHTILSEGRYGKFAGTNVERDFVEAPSQMFENWVWDAEVLATFARHYKTGEPLPADLLDGMIRARYLASALEAEHQFYYGLVDFEYHSTADGEIDTTRVANDLFAEIELFPRIDHVAFQASFTHLANDGYTSGYYGYQWSLVYAQDMFQRFKELGMLDPEAGMYYRKKVLSRGGTIDGMDMVKEYLGREPSMEPYLRHLGLKREDTASTSP
jgi:thimet oligopeptidase